MILKIIHYTRTVSHSIKDSPLPVQNYQPMLQKKDRQTDTLTFTHRMTIILIPQHALRVINVAICGNYCRDTYQWVVAFSPSFAISSCLLVVSSPLLVVSSPPLVVSPSPSALGIPPYHHYFPPISSQLHEFYLAGCPILPQPYVFGFQ